MALGSSSLAEMAALDLDERDDAAPLFGEAAGEIGALFRGANDAQPTRDADFEPAAPAGVALAVQPVAAHALEVHPVAGAADWTKTLTLVERASATIRAYEKRFLQLEKQAKGLADRSVEDQRRLQLHIRALEERLKNAEERTAAAEIAARDAEYHEWEAETRAKRAEQRAEEAEERTRQAETYLRRVHELLSAV